MGSRTSLSHYWILQNESWEHVENIHKYIHIYSFCFWWKFWNFLFFLFKSCFLLLPHITPNIFLLLHSFNVQCLRRDESPPWVRGWQMEGGGPMRCCLGFAPYPMRSWFQGTSSGRMGSRALSPLQLLTRWVGTERGTSLAFITAQSQHSCGWQGHCPCSWACLLQWSIAESTTPLNFWIYLHVKSS